MTGVEFPRSAWLAEKTRKQKIQKLLKTHGTTFTVGLFLVSTVSGVFLFFHVASPTFHAMHEWLSMLLIVPVAFHVWKNWAAFKAYFKRRTIVVPLALSVVAGVAFAYPSLTAPSSGGNPMRAAIKAVESGTLTQVAPLYELTPEALSERLAAKGYTVTSTEQTLTEIAEASGKKPGRELLAAIAFAN